MYYTTFFTKSQVLFLEFFELFVFGVGEFRLGGIGVMRGAFFVWCLGCKHGGG